MIQSTRVPGKLWFDLVTCVCTYISRSMDVGWDRGGIKGHGFLEQRRAPRTLKTPGERARGRYEASGLDLEHGTICAPLSRCNGLVMRQSTFQRLVTVWYGHSTRPGPLKMSHAPERVYSLSHEHVGRKLLSSSAVWIICQPCWATILQLLVHTTLESRPTMAPGAKRWRAIFQSRVSRLPRFDNFLKSRVVNW